MPAPDLFSFIEAFLKIIDDQQMLGLKARAHYVSLDMSDFEPYPLIVYSLGGAWLVESLNPSPNRPHVHFKKPAQLNPWLAGIRGEVYVPPPRIQTISEGYGLFDLIKRDDYPEGPIADLLEVLGRKKLQFPFNRQGLSDLLDIFQSKRRFRLSDEGRWLATFYVIETIRQAVKGEWTSLDTPWGKELAILTPNGRVLNLTPEIGHRFYKHRGAGILGDFDHCVEESQQPPLET